MNNRQSAEAQKAPKQNKTKQVPLIESDPHNQLVESYKSIEVIYEDHDEKSEVHARIWNQFVRRKIVNEHILKRVDKDANYAGGMIVTSSMVRSSFTQSRKSIPVPADPKEEKDIYARY